MIKITLFAVLAMWLFAFAGSKSSVGGPMGLVMICFITMLAVAVYEAWSNKRDALGWFVNIVLSVIGGLIAVSFGGMAMESIISAVRFEGSLAASGHPLLYVLSAAMAIITVLGAWLPIRLINRFRQQPPQ